jgi:hypothetical protein
MRAPMLQQGLSVIFRNGIEDFSLSFPKQARESGIGRIERFCEIER